MGELSGWRGREEEEEGRSDEEWNRGEAMSCMCPNEEPQRRVSKRRRIPEEEQGREAWSGPAPACTAKRNQHEEEEEGGESPEGDRGSC